MFDNTSQSALIRPDLSDSSLASLSVSINMAKAVNVKELARINPTFSRTDRACLRRGDE
ncbi:hypothetical protein [Mesorhizobium sp. ISC15]|uniref:hypothetical protein n=1 Tax=Mesorhizobium sp. ISC15 TaxID=3076429 RepID=UPI00301E4FA3